VLLIFGFAIGMACVLNYFKFESTLDHLQRSRIALVAHEIADNAEKQLTIGLALADNPALQQQLQSKLKVDPLIAAIVLVDAQGRTLARSGSAAAVADAAQPFTLSRVVHDAFGEVAGSVLVRYARSSRAQQLARVRNALWRSGGLAFGLFVGAALLLLAAARRRLAHALAADLRVVQARVAEADAAISDVEQRIARATP